MTSILVPGGGMTVVPLSMESPPDLQVVIQAIKTLYHDPDPRAKESASTWLGHLQSSLFAWTLSDHLLIARIDIESCYFAAQTLRTKLQHSFHELGIDSCPSLKDSLLNHLFSINESVIQTQLALALVYLAILVPTWTNPIEELVAKQLDSSVLIEFLTYLPEEIDSSRHSTLRGVGANRRTQFTSYLKSVSPQVIKLLVTVIESSQNIPGSSQNVPGSSQNVPGSSQNVQSEPSSKLVSKVYRCLGSWLPMIESPTMDAIEPILNSIFNSLRDPGTSDLVHDASADTVCGLALMCENYEKYREVTHYLLTQITSLDVMLHHSIANEDLDKSINYSRIFTEMAESVVDSIMSKYGEEKSPECDLSLNLINLVLDCVSHYDYEVAEITFHFWYRLSEVVVKKKNDHLLLLFHSFGHRLLRAITKHCQPESDQEGILSTDTDIYDFRLRVRDLVKEMVYIIGALNYVNSNKILATVQSHLTNLVLSNSNSGWEEIEAELFLLSSLAPDLTLDSDLISNLINIILSTAYRSIPSGQGTGNHGNQMVQLKNVQPLHPQIMATSCSILGELADWLNSNPQFLDSVLNYLLTIITNSKEWDSSPSSSSFDECEKATLSSTAASALQPIIQSCASRHLSRNPKLIGILIQICSNLDAIGNESTAHHLLQCCSSMISAPTEQVEEMMNLQVDQTMNQQVDQTMNQQVDQTMNQQVDQTMNQQVDQTRKEERIFQQEEMVIQLVNPHLQSLKQIVAFKSSQSINEQSQSVSVSEQSQLGSRDPCVYLDRLAAIFRSLKMIRSDGITPDQSLLSGSITPDQSRLSGSITPDQSRLSGSITNDLWPVMDATLRLYISESRKEEREEGRKEGREESRVIERTCRVVRFVIRCLRPHWLLQPIATTIVTLYQRNPRHSSFLYLASILVDEFAGTGDTRSVSREGREELTKGDFRSITREGREELTNGLINMLNAFCLPTFHLLTAPNVELRNHPETIDDFFRLCTRFLQKMPHKFLTESMLDSIFNLTIASIRLDHREANLSVTKFLIELIYTSHSPTTSKEAGQIVATILNNRIGQMLLDAVINCALFHLPSYFVPEMADILWQMVQWNREAVNQWLGEVLKTVPVKSSSGAIAATPEQLQEFYNSVTTATHPKSVAQALRTLSRLYR